MLLTAPFAQREAHAQGGLAVAEPAATTSARARPPASAAEALERATAAYEEGDVRLMVELARRVAEGGVPGNDDQRATALRLLGIGLYLDGRLDGAERAFLDLLVLRPDSRLDPSVTRPEIVTFFRDVRRRSQPPKHLALVFMPPFGQFQNGTPKRGFVIGGLEALTLGTAVTSRILLGSWRSPEGNTCRGRDDTSSCDSMRLVNYVSVGALVGTFVWGVVDAWLGLDRGATLEAREDEVKATLALFPNGAGLSLRF